MNARPLGPIPKRIVQLCKTKSNTLDTPEMGTLYTSLESTVEHLTHGSDENDLIAVDTHGPRVKEKGLTCLAE